MSIEYYFQKVEVTETLFRWRMLTGNQDNLQVSDRDLAERFIPVVYKMLRKGTAEPGPWMVMHSDGLEDELQDPALEEKLEEAADVSTRFNVALVDVGERHSLDPQFTATYEVQVLPEEVSQGSLAAWVLGSMAAVAIGVVLWNSRK